MDGASLGGRCSAHALGGELRAAGAFRRLLRLTGADGTEVVRWFSEVKFYVLMVGSSTEVG